MILGTLSRSRHSAQAPHTENRYISQQDLGKQLVFYRVSCPFRVYNGSIIHSVTYSVFLMHRRKDLWGPDGQIYSLVIRRTEDSSV